SAAGGGTAFLVIHENAPFSLLRAIGNAALRHLDFWGVPTMAILAAALWTWPRRGISRERFVPAVLVATVVWFEILFLRLPAEPAYLLPALPSAIGLLAWGHGHSRWLAAVVIAGVLHGAVQISLLRTPSMHQAISVLQVGSVPL